MVEAILAMNSGGLANRIQNVESCLLLARRLDVPLSIVWTQNKQLATPFHALFETPHGVTVVEADEWSKTKKGLEDFNPDVVIDWENDEGLGKISDDEVIETVAKWQRPDIRVFWRFFTGDVRGQTLKLAQPVASAVNASEHLARGKIGVHIRRGDHKGSRAHSPDHSFLLLLDNAPKEQHFFLCTDDPVVESMIVERFPGRVHLRPKTTLDRTEKEAAIEALIDLSLLSRADAVIGSFGSTFGNCAAFWGNKLVHHARVGT